MTRNQFVVSVGSENAAIEIETRILSAGEEFLPPIAKRVLRGKAPSRGYWDWLYSQAKVMLNAR